jgi:hypothetical protein
LVTNLITSDAVTEPINENTGINSKKQT